MWPVPQIQRLLELSAQTRRQAAEEADLALRRSLMEYANDCDAEIAQLESESLDHRARRRLAA